MKKEEHIEQVKFVNWLLLKFPEIRFYAIPNGGHRNIIVARQMKAEGVMRGVPDLHFPSLRLWVEMKKKKGGRLSADQREWKDYLKEIGDTFLVCNGFDDAVRQFEGIINGKQIKKIDI